MKYYNKYLLIASWLLLVVMIACSDDSDQLEPGDKFVNYFEADPSDNSLDAQIRRGFYDRTGTYLLFTDELARYTDQFGMERVERVDFNYNLTDNNSWKWTFDILTEDEKTTVIPLFEKYFIPYINGGKIMPYSFMLVKNLYTNQKRSSRMELSQTIKCMRCLGINMDDWIGTDEEEARRVGANLLRTIVDVQLTSSSPELDEFFAVCKDAYDEYYVHYLIPDWLEDQDETKIYELGFMSYYPDSWGEPDYDAFPVKKNDLKNFMDALFSGEEDAFMEEWGEYPNVILKYNLLKQCVEEMGIDFNGVK